MKFAGLGLVVALALLLSAGPASIRAEAEETALFPFVESLSVTVDGVVGGMEYPAAGVFVDVRTGMVIRAAQDGIDMAVALTSPGTGWLSVGFGRPGVVMDGDNILMGFVSGGTTVLTDQFGLGLEHAVDESLGGRDNVLAAAGTESGAGTTIEFRFPLDTGDPYDYRLQPGRTYGLMFAYAATADDLVTMHTSASLALVTIEPDPSRIPTRIASLALEAVGTPVEGGAISLNVLLTGDDGLPYAPAQIGFYVNSSVGLGLLDFVDVDPNGTASLNYTFLTSGPVPFVARFDGDLDYLPANATLTVVAELAPRESPFLALDFAARFLVFTVLASVVIVYLFAIGQVGLVWRLGRRAADGKGPRGGVSGARDDVADRKEGQH